MNGSVTDTVNGESRWWVQCHTEIDPCNSPRCGDWLLNTGDCQIYQFKNVPAGTQQGCSTTKFSGSGCTAGIATGCGPCTGFMRSGTCGCQEKRSQTSSRGCDVRLGVLAYEGRWIPTGQFLNCAINCQQTEQCLRQLPCFNQMIPCSVTWSVRDCDPLFTTGHPLQIASLVLGGVPSNLVPSAGSFSFVSLNELCARLSLPEFGWQCLHVGGTWLFVNQTGAPVVGASMITFLDTVTVLNTSYDVQVDCPSCGCTGCPVFEQSPQVLVNDQNQMAWADLRCLSPIFEAAFDRAGPFLGAGPQALTLSMTPIKNSSDIIFDGINTLTIKRSGDYLFKVSVAVHQAAIPTLSITDVSMRIEKTDSTTVLEIPGQDLVAGLTYPTGQTLSINALIPLGATESIRIVVLLTGANLAGYIGPGSISIERRIS